MTRWRVGRKVPINVYDGDRPICQCHTDQDARLIVSAVNARLAADEFKEMVRLKAAEFSRETQ